MHKETLRSMQDVEIFPIIALILFFTFFVMMVVRVVKKDKKEWQGIAENALEDGSKQSHFVDGI